MIELPELLLADAVAWRKWLAEHHAEPGVWLVLHKKGGTVTSLTYEEALDEALCFGWVDGQKGSRDGGSFRQRFTPRTSRSAWSARNVAHVERLTVAGRMHSVGQAAVEAAKADGRWSNAYAGQADAAMAEDLAAAIAANPAAAMMLGRLNSTNRYALIYRVNAVKRSETRARKIAQFVEMLARGETIYPQQGS